MKIITGVFLLFGVGSIDAAQCNTTALAKLLVTSDVRTCRTDSGYDPTSMTAVTDAQVAAVCNSQACTRAIDAVKQVAPTECTVGTVQLYANVIDPLERRCGRNSGSVGMSGNATGNGSAPAAGDEPTTSPPRSNTPSPPPRNAGAEAPALSTFTAVAVLTAVVAAIL